MNPTQDNDAKIKKSHSENEAALWRVLLDQSRDGVVVLAVNGKVHSANQKFADILGYTKEELRNLRVWTWDAFLTVEQIKAMLEMADQAGIILQTIHRRKDGTTFDVEISANASMFNDEKLIFCVCQDITERKKAEKALQESENRFRTLVNQAADAFVLVDDQGRILDVNQAACSGLGYSREELLRLSVYDIVMNAKPVDNKVNYWNQLTPGKTLRFESQIRHKSGALFPSEVSLGLVELGERRLMLGLARNISERKRLERQLRQAQKMEAVGQLAGGVAHDFNNMLSVIIGGVEMILDQLDAKRPLYASLQVIRKAAERSAELTRQLLAFARKQTVAPKVLDLNTTIEGVLKMLRRLIGEDIQLAWRPGPNIPSIRIDPTQVDQILVHLCVNARNAIAGIGTLSIETVTTTLDEAYCAEHTGLQPGDYVALIVRDDGCEMDKEVLDKIFEPYAATTEISKGTGLGLATVYGIVKQNRGTIDVASESGQGNTFKIYLPVYNARKIRSADQSTYLIEKGDETILLVEDEFTMMNMGRNVLEKAGYRVLSARTPGEALTQAEEYAGSIHLLLSDIVLPEMNGRDLAAKIETIQPDLKILFMSGFTPSDLTRYGIDGKAINFIQKPFSMQALASKVREVLDQ
jgi:PAS domain S-box-containing protein